MLTAKYLPATNKLGARIKVSNGYVSKTYSYYYFDKDPYIEALKCFIKAFYTKGKWDFVTHTSGTTLYAIIVNNDSKYKVIV